MNRKDQLLKKFLKSKNEVDWKDYKDLRHKCTSLIRKAREQHHEALVIDNEKNSKKFRKSSSKRKSTKLNSSSSVPIIKDTIFGITGNNNANIFCNYYSSVANLLQTKASTLKILLGVVQ